MREQTCKISHTCTAQKASN